ncbi:MAG: hypothetical protein UT93_C0035G0010 [Candidatus Woesebacteria bacterium GW2011_GWF1_40_24]|uniref:Uncharacterized protein n=2 Tax=Bacteria candidate phyla TaxID=1783234 RepID=A0A0G0UW29_9BACT|nr:MAG: hypothetical protein UT93_C0035G0010 [Candidatus Woesebacteria bacterium GW2011_GWF1_40_24]KKS05329.1 MAG: hypothetical protein UU59_C0049G0006 [candidate division WWE3 bacterium GW2011_GWE1_41_27]
MWVYVPAALIGVQKAPMLQPITTCASSIININTKINAETKVIKLKIMRKNIFLTPSLKAINVLTPTKIEISNTTQKNVLCPSKHLSKIHCSEKRMLYISAASRSRTTKSRLFHIESYTSNFM